MKLKHFSLVYLMAVNGAYANHDVIYGVDNRVETMNATALYKKLAASSAAMISDKELISRGSGFEISGESIGERFNLCQDQRFKDQPAVANCSGFLVAPDKIVTAGHCYRNAESNCTNYKWVFGYQVNDENQTSVTVPASEVYSCKNIIKVEESNKTDFAIIQLDRPVKGRTPVKIATAPHKLNDPLVLIGHPWGIPQKVADGGAIRSIASTNFKATVDAFQSNSGSPVFHSKTGEVVGILVSGEADSRSRDMDECIEMNVLPENSPGETVSSYTQFASYLK